MQARGWARVARASARVHNDPYDPGVNAALFDAIEYAATQARLGTRDLVDAYLAGAPQLDVHEAWENVEVSAAHRRRTRSEHRQRVRARRPRVARLAPRLAMRIAAHDLALTTHRAIGAQDERIDVARRAVVEVLDGAQAAGATEEELDSYIAELRVAQCDLAAVIITAAWIAAERAVLAQRRATPLPRSAWATVPEIAADRGVSVDVRRRADRGRCPPRSARA